MIIINSITQHKAELSGIKKLIIDNKKSQLLSIAGALTSNTLRDGGYKKNTLHIDLSALNHILSISLEEKWVLVEPKVTFYELCRVAIKYGLVPPVVPEFKTITIGGAINGGALESSSHRYGQVSDCCLSYECILGNGEVVTASPNEHPDLFYGISGSYGTLALITLIQMRLIKAQKFVRVRCTLFNTTHQIVQCLSAPQQQEFHEGVILDKNRSLVLSGSMSEKAFSSHLSTQKPWSKWFIQHLQKHPTEFTMSLLDYLFRFDRGAFWMGRFATSFRTLMQLITKIGTPPMQNRYPSFFLRLLFGWFLTSRRLYSMWHRVPLTISENLFFVHDFYAPARNAQDLLSRLITETEIFPIWLCPIQGTQTPQFLSPHFGKERFLNIGLYGTPKCKAAIPSLVAKLEGEISHFGGRKMLYSYTYYDRKTFAALYDEPRYNALRKKFFAEDLFLHIYNKIINNSPF